MSSQNHTCHPERSEGSWCFARSGSTDNGRYAPKDKLYPLKYGSISLNAGDAEDRISS